MIRLIEELSLNALPALQTAHYDGWVLRLSNGFTRRGNSVNPLYPSGLPLEEKIAYCEHFYAAQGLNSTYFKMTSLAQPEDLDAVLERRGYINDAVQGVQVVSLAGFNQQQQANGISITRHLSEDWLAAYWRLNAINQRYFPVVKAILGNISLPTCYVTLCWNDTIVSIGMGVLERDYLGIFEIATAAEARSRGFATQVVLHLLQWGLDNGAEHAYLQVRKDNAPAIRLYAKLGFREVYTYWYRTKSQA